MHNFKEPKSSTSPNILFLLILLLLLKPNVSLHAQSHTYYRLYKVSYAKFNKSSHIKIKGNLVLARRTQSNVFTFYENDNFFSNQFGKSSDSFTTHSIHVKSKTPNKFEATNPILKKYLSGIYLHKNKLYLVHKNGAQYIFKPSKLKTNILNKTSDSLKFIYLINPNSLYKTNSLLLLQDSFFMRYTVLTRPASVKRKVNKDVLIKTHQKKIEKRQFYINRIQSDSHGRQKLDLLITRHKNRKNRETNFQIKGASQMVNGGKFKTEAPLDDIKSIRYFDMVSWKSLLTFFYGYQISGGALFAGLILMFAGAGEVANLFFAASILIMFISLLFLTRIKLKYRIKNNNNKTNPLAWKLRNGPM